MDLVTFLVHLIIYVAVVGFLLYGLRMLMEKLKVPEPFSLAIWIIVFIAILIAFLKLIGKLGGKPVLLFEL